MMDLTDAALVAQARELVRPTCSYEEEVEFAAEIATALGAVRDAATAAERERCRAMEVDAETRACAAEERAAVARKRLAQLAEAATRLYQATTTVDAHNREAVYALRDALAALRGGDHER